MKILVLNSGSSSIKFQLFEMTERRSIASGIIENIGDGTAKAKIYSDHGATQETAVIRSHQEGMAVIERLLNQSGVLQDIGSLDAVGHRVVHGGETFREPVIIDDEVISAINDLIPLAPLHNPANLEGIITVLQKAPQTVQVAVFDTAFHQNMPPSSYLYALPYELYEKYRVRRYGFHGTSHHFVAKKAAECLDRPLEQLRIITLHLGNGSSAAAIKYGVCIDTSMGMTPLEGLVMGTRSGDVDPGVLFYLARQMNLSIDEIDTLLNKESGLKGICGVNDMRTIMQLADKGDERALLALEIFCYRIKKYIGAYSASLGGADAVVFTGGIGENSAFIRAKVCEGLEYMGIEIASEEYRRQDGIVTLHSRDSRVNVLAIPTDEELEIALQTQQLLQKKITT